MDCPGVLYITRFYDDGTHYKKSYGHARMTTDLFEALMAKLRAFVRPHYGEIWIGKRDSHPSLNARDMREHMAENQIVDQVTGPYRHQSMPVENTWSHDVPRSMILLHQGPGKEHLQHFLAAFLIVPRARLEPDGEAAPWLEAESARSRRGVTRLRRNPTRRVNPLAG